ncbi:hypothetical protein VAR608DRAFT_2000 [Variovorax sp. HW608]|uniref:hypothetical protein n=1 Tax=Variovorax sp. HW608 TaxID=1034889 RepID=UPI00081FFEF6|nr:hypothetical protein [Variovorax sp. HW608]SCK25029.1 hypothetical protein VAR608DRAFT_2000 [Variovorax sp. HW608]
MRIQSSFRSPRMQRLQFNEDPVDVRDRYEWTLSYLEQEYPVIDPDSSEYNEPLMFEVYRRLKGLVMNGLPPARALELAASEVLRPLSH